jgi:uncharacterized protein
VTLYYADTSAVIRAYFADEPDHTPLRRLLLSGRHPVVTSELTRVEFASAVAAAHRGGRVVQPERYLDWFDEDCDQDGPLTLVRLDAAAVLPFARELVTVERLHTLDAIHLAVALTDGRALAAGDQVVLVTRDTQQAIAAKARGMSVA